MNESKVDLIHTSKESDKDEVERRCEIDRRTFLGTLSLAGLQACSGSKQLLTKETVLNDVHSRLNATRVSSVTTPTDTRSLVRQLATTRERLSISGTRHSMGGQQFAEDSQHISTIQHSAIGVMDVENGLIEVSAGVTWPQLVTHLLEQQQGSDRQWGITQKQTGADVLTLGGAVSSNIHGRGLTLKPFIQDVESLTIVDAEGKLQTISRQHQPQLFSLVHGGYGLFGYIDSIKLRLSKRRKLERHVQILPLEALVEISRSYLDNGYLYGDFQYKTNERSADFMETGVFSAYRPIDDPTPIADNQRRLTPENWNKLLALAFLDKEEAFRQYSTYYLSTSGQHYWSDTHQLSYYNPDYHTYLKGASTSLSASTLIITEVYVPPQDIVAFTREIKKGAIARGLNIIYGTMRLIRKDDESFLPWAKQDYACIIFNLGVENTPTGLAKAAEDFRFLIDVALDFDGSYFLTYHRFARKDQVLRAYPKFIDFLKLKRQYDPEERFDSTWYQLYRKMFSEELQS